MFDGVSSRIGSLRTVVTRSPGAAAELLVKGAAA